MNEQDLRDEHSYLQVRADEYLRRQARKRGMSRRQFLQLLAAGAASVAPTAALLRNASGARAAPAPTELVVKPTPPELFYDFGSNKEMRWENLAGRGIPGPQRALLRPQSHPHPAHRHRDLASEGRRLGSGAAAGTHV